MKSKHRNDELVSAMRAYQQENPQVSVTQLARVFKVSRNVVTDAEEAGGFKCLRHKPGTNGHSGSWMRKAPLGKLSKG